MGGRLRGPLAAILLSAAASVAYGHGDVAPQPLNTDALPDVGEEWLEANPYTAEAAGESVWETAVHIGDSGFNQNCARCHGLGAVSGGLAPVLRYLEFGPDGDEWFLERFIHGYTQDGTTKMPAFGEVLGQKAGWAIRTYFESRPDDEVLAEHSDRLVEIRDQLTEMSASGGGDSEALKVELLEIAASIPTLSGAPVSDSIARRAGKILDGTPASYKAAADVLTVGLSDAK